MNEPTTEVKPTIESIHRDIALANQYRLELIKHLLAISAALFAFTVTFRPALERIDFGWSMWLGWAGLGLSMIGGMFHMLGWDHYYKSYRDHDWKGNSTVGKIARRRINIWRRTAMVLQFGGFLVGVVGIGLFAGANIDNSTTRENEGPAAVRDQSPPVEQSQRSTANEILKRGG